MAQPKLRTGKLPPVPDHRDALFTQFATVRLIAPQVPAEFGHEEAVERLGEQWGMLGNGPDPTVKQGFRGAGDCVFAGGDHEHMMWNAEVGKKVAFTGANAISDYSKVTGYVVGDDSTDNGTQVRDALKYRQSTGLVDKSRRRHKLGAYVQLEPGNSDHIRQALYLLSAVGIGFAFPETAMQQFLDGKPWSVVAGAQAPTGHYVPAVAVRPGGIVVVTWGKLQLMTWPFFAKYCDEAWGLLSREFIKSGKSPEGFDLQALLEYLPQLKN
jgi:hypothetical protein